MSKPETAASLLRDLRRRQGDSLRAAASGIGVAPSQLSRMERGERAVGDAVVRRLSEYYQIPPEVIALSQGQLPDDVVAILRNHPEEIARLRDLYGE